MEPQPTVLVSRVSVLEDTTFHLERRLNKQDQDIDALRRNVLSEQLKMHKDFQQLMDHVVDLKNNPMDFYNKVGNDKNDFSTAFVPKNQTPPTSINLEDLLSLFNSKNNDSFGGAGGNDTSSAMKLFDAISTFVNRQVSAAMIRPGRGSNNHNDTTALNLAREVESELAALHEQVSSLHHAQHDVEVATAERLSNVESALLQMDQAVQRSELAADTLSKRMKSLNETVNACSQQVQLGSIVSAATATPNNNTNAVQQPLSSSHSTATTYDEVSHRLHKIEEHVHLRVEEEALIRADAVRRLESTIDSLRSDVLPNVRSHNDKLQTLQREITNHGNEVKRHNDTTDRLRHDLECLKAVVDKLALDCSSLDSRLQKSVRDELQRNEQSIQSLVRRTEQHILDERKSFELRIQNDLKRLEHRHDEGVAQFTAHIVSEVGAMKTSSSETTRRLERDMDISLQAHSESVEKLATQLRGNVEAALQRASSRLSDEQTAFFDKTNSAVSVLTSRTDKDVKSLMFHIQEEAKRIQDSVADTHKRFVVRNEEQLRLLTARIDTELKRHGEFIDLRLDTVHQRLDVGENNSTYPNVHVEQQPQMPQQQQQQPLSVSVGGTSVLSASVISAPTAAASPHRSASPTRLDALTERVARLSEQLLALQESVDVSISETIEKRLESEQLDLLRDRVTTLENRSVDVAQDIDNLTVATTSVSGDVSKVESQYRALSDAFSASPWESCSRQVEGQMNVVIEDKLSNALGTVRDVAREGISDLSERVEALQSEIKSVVDDVLSRVNVCEENALSLQAGDAAKSKDFEKLHRDVAETREGLQMAMDAWTDHINSRLKKIERVAGVVSVVGSSKPKSPTSSSLSSSKPPLAPSTPPKQTIRPVERRADPSSSSMTISSGSVPQTQGSVVPTATTTTILSAAPTTAAALLFDDNNNSDDVDPLAGVFSDEASP
eukprot:PhM_4_TR16145/c1_g1_i1/m.31786